MALLRKIVDVGNSKAVTIPRSYLDYWQRKGKEITQVELVINDKILISPVFKKIAGGIK